MGALHSGHMSLIRRAREQCEVVVVSLFVNPTQFNERADLAAYPRNEARDALLATRARADYLFAPAVDELYPDGFATTVTVAGVSEPLEGEQRGRLHFDGVATIVLKLLNIVAPDVVYFGRKDAQQVLVIRRALSDLNVDVRIEACPIVRDRDGLALSSRNAHLSPAERKRAASLHRVLAQMAARARAGERDLRALRARARAELDGAGVATEYLEIVNPDTLTPLAALAGPALALVAARVGSTRLIDNEPLLTADGAQLAEAAGSS